MQPWQQSALHLRLGHAHVNPIALVALGLARGWIHPAAPDTGGKNPKHSAYMKLWKARRRKAGLPV